MATASQDDLRELETRLNDRYEQLRKLVNQQAIAIDNKIKNLDAQLGSFVNRRPDPTLVRDFWVRQVPKIRDQIKMLEMDLAGIKAASNKGNV
jgi:hypothetical protein